MKKLRIAVLISGGGTNLQAMIDRSLAGTLDAEIAVVLSDRPGAGGLERARKNNIPAYCVDYKSISASAMLDAKILPDMEELDSRQKILRNPDPVQRLARLSSLVLAEKELIRIIDSYGVDYVCLAGFMRLVTPYFIGHFNGGRKTESGGGEAAAWRILNIHPALLPSFPGRHGYEDTFGYGCKWGGITVHFVDEGEDTGPIIAQAVYPIWPEDSIDNIRSRGLQLEYEVYSQALNWLAHDEVEIRDMPDGDSRVVISDPRYRDILNTWIGKAFL